MPGAGDPVRSAALSGGAWVGAAIALQAAGKLAIFVMLARFVQPAAFGLFAAATVFVALASHLAHLGLGMAVVQRPALTAPELRAANGLALAAGLTVTLLTFAGAPLLAHAMQMPRLTDVLRWLAPCLLLTAIGVCAEAQLQRHLRFRRLATIDVLAFGAGYGIAGVGLALSGGGIWALVGAALVESAARTALLLQAAPVAGGPSFAAWRSAGALVRFGSGATLGRLFNEVALRADYLVVGRVLGVASLGLYERAYTLVQGAGTLLGQTAAEVLFPVLSTQPDRSGRYLEGVTRLVGIVLLPAAAVTVVVAEPLIVVAFGDRWRPMVLPLQVLVAGVMARAGYKIADAVVRAHGQVFRRAGVQAVYALSVASGAAIGTLWQVAGVAVGVLVAITLHYLLMGRLATRCAGVTYRAWLLWHAPGAVVAVAAAAAAWSAGSVAPGGAMGEVALGGLSGAVVAATVVVTARRVLLGPAAGGVVEAATGFWRAVRRRLGVEALR